MAQYGFFAALNTRIRVTEALLIQGFKRHRAGARLGFVLTLAENAAGVLVIGLLFSLIGRHAPLGDDIMLFLLSGLIPFSVFQTASSKAGMSVQATARANRNPMVTTTGKALATTLETLVVYCIIGVILLAYVGWSGSEYAFPYAPQLCAGAMLIAAAIGFGIGLLNAVIDYFISGWAAIYSMATRGMFLLSGVFFLPETLPPTYRDMLAWNPLLHVIAYFRSGLYPTYPEAVLDPLYMSIWAFALVFLGLWTERLLRRKIQ
ncbi:MAG: ABC transporter permease [Neomegalonema sp.]|nr:ABC transporter permease [Neomegalonema sp.]